jgi:hypothetical protein
VGLNNAFGDMLLMFVTGTMFIVLPTFWIMALAWAGVRAGQRVARPFAGSNRRCQGQAGGRVPEASQSMQEEVIAASRPRHEVNA